MCIQFLQFVFEFLVNILKLSYITFDSNLYLHTLPFFLWLLFYATYCEHFCTCHHPYSDVYTHICCLIDPMTCSVRHSVAPTPT